MNKSSFVFYKDWKKAIECLPDDIRLEIYESIIEYATTGDLRGLKPMANVAFNFIKTDIDRDTEKYMSVIERNKHNGNKGGRPKKNPNNPVGFLETQRNPKNPIMSLILILILKMNMILSLIEGAHLRRAPAHPLHYTGK